MYEFSKKEIRNKFKETEYGKSTNKWLYISLGCVGGLFLIALVIVFLVLFKVISMDSETLPIIAGVFSYLIFISFIISCYFDGKRDGAIEQFKRSLKTK